MNKNLLYNGIVVDANTSGAQAGLVGLMRTQNQLLRDSRVFAQQLPKNWDNAFTAPMKKFRQTLGATHKDIHQFNYEVRKLANNMNSVVMAGVAVSMTGVGIQNFGRQVTGFFASTIASARDFERAMTDIKFLGQLTDAETITMQHEIMKTGMSLPTTNQKVAEGMIQAMRAGFNAKDAEKLMKPIADLVFMSMDKLDETRAVKFINDFLKTTEQGVDNIDRVIDKIAKTTQQFPTDIEGLWRIWQSSAAAFDNLGLGRQEKGDSTMLTLAGGMSTTFNERRAGMSLNSLGRGILQASQSEGKRGEIFNSLGIDLDAETDLIDTLYKIYDNGLKKYGRLGEGILEEGNEFHAKLLRAFGLESLPVFQMIEKYRRQGLDLKEIRDSIDSSEGYTKEYMDLLMGTFYGTQKIFEGISETFKTLIGLSILRPVNILLQGVNTVLKKLTEFAEAHPNIIKFISLAGLLAGAFALVAGTVLLFAGGIMAMVGSIGSGITALANLSGATYNAMGGFAKGGASVAQVWKGVILPPIFNTIKAIARFTAMSGLAYLAWKHDLLGIRTQVGRVANAFQEAGNYVRMLFGANGNTVSQFKADLKTLNSKDPLKAWFINKMALTKGLGMMLKGLWKNNVITAEDLGGEEEFKRIVGLWQELGLFPVAEMILGYRDNINAFFKGFRDGFESAASIVLKTTKTIGKAIMWVYDKFVDFGSALGLIDPDSHRLESRFENIGNIFGKIAGTIAGIIVSMKLWRMTLGPVFSMLRGIGGLALFGKSMLWDNPKNFVQGGGMKQTAGKMARTPINAMAHAMALDKLFPSVFNKNGTVKPIDQKNTTIQGPMPNNTGPNASNGYAQNYQLTPNGYQTADGQPYQTPRQNLIAPKGSTLGQRLQHRVQRMSLANPFGMENRATKNIPSNLQDGAMVRTAKEPKTIRGQIGNFLWGEKLAVTPTKNNPNKMSVGYVNPDGSKGQQFKNKDDVRHYKSIGGGYRTNQGILSPLNSMVQGTREGIRRTKDGIGNVIGGVSNMRKQKRTAKMNSIYQNAGMGSYEQNTKGKGFFSKMAQNAQARYKSAINTTGKALGRGEIYGKNTGGMYQKQSLWQRATMFPRTLMEHKKNKQSNIIAGGNVTQDSVRNAKQAVINRDMARNANGVGGMMNSMPFFGKNTDGSNKKGRQMFANARERIGRARTSVGNFATRATQPIAKVGGAIGNTVGKVGRGVGAVGGAIGKGVGAVGKGVGAVARGGMAVGGMIGNTAKVGMQAGTGIVGGMGKAIFGGIGKVFGAAFRMLNWVGLAMFAWQIISMVWSNWDTIKEKAMGAFQWMATTGMEKLGTMWTWLTTDGVGKLGELFTWLAFEAVPMAISTVRTWFSGLFEGTNTDGQSSFNRLFTWLTTEIIPMAVEQLSTWFGIAFEFISTTGVEKVGQFFTWIRDTALPSTIDFIGNAFSSVFNWIMTDGVMYFGNIITWVVGTGIPFLVVNATKLILGLFTWIFTDGMLYFGKLISWVVMEAIPGLVTGLLTLFSGLWDGVTEMGKKAFNSVAAWAKEKLNFTISIPKLLGGGSVTLGVNGISYNGHNPSNNTGTSGGVTRPDGSHRTGLHKVPYDGYMAQLHAGEMVVPRSEAQFLRALMGTGSVMDAFDVDTVSAPELSAPTPTKTTSTNRIKPVSQGSTTSTQSHSGGGGNTTITFGSGAVQVSVENMTDPNEIKKGAEQMFKEFKRLVELENMRNYRPSRG